MSSLPATVKGAGLRPIATGGCAAPVQPRRRGQAQAYCAAPMHAEYLFDAPMNMSAVRLRTAAILGAAERVDSRPLARCR